MKDEWKKRKRLSGRMKIPLNEEGMRGKKDKKIFKERNQN